MKKEIVKIFVIAGASLLSSCSNVDHSEQVNEPDTTLQVKELEKTNPHPFGGWYCPDNLNGFPPVDIADWKNVPVVNGRMPTKEEAENGTSLIFVDPAEYPNAKVLGVQMPKLASYSNANASREDIIIVIQAFSVDNDSIVGFRFLNGGNGSARLSEIRFLTDGEIAKMSDAWFVSVNLEINASPATIRNVMTEPEYTEKLQDIFDLNNQLKGGWRDGTNVNFKYPDAGELTARFANVIFGNFYIQNDYTEFTEKFLLLEIPERKCTELKIACGPFKKDYDQQKVVLMEWAKLVKVLSER